MKLSKKIFRILAVMVLLTPLFSKYGYTANAPEVKLLVVPPGFVVPNDGDDWYLLNAAALSDLTAAAKTYRMERDAWSNAYYNLEQASKEHDAQMTADLDQLETNITEERKAWAAQKYRPGLIVGFGAGYTFGNEIKIGLWAGYGWKF